MSQSDLYPIRVTTKISDIPHEAVRSNTASIVNPKLLSTKVHIDIQQESSIVSIMMPLPFTVFHNPHVVVRMIFIDKMSSGAGLFLETMPYMYMYVIAI